MKEKQIASVLEQSEESMADNAIIDLYWERNERAIVETDKKYGKHLYTIAYNIVHDSMDTEECVNDTYRGTWERIPPAKPGVFQAFLSKITRNIAISKYRRKHASKRIPSELTVSLEELEPYVAFSPSVEEEFAAGELGHLLSIYLRSLSKQREFIFVCRYYYADPVGQIAAMLGVTPRTVYRELTEIKEGLRAFLEKEGFGV